jgi:hypothetical protein
MLNGFIGNNLQQHETLRTIRDKRGKRILIKSKKANGVFYLLQKKHHKIQREGRRGKPKERILLIKVRATGKLLSR